MKHAAIQDTPSVGRLIRQATARLAGLDTARLDAELLLSHVTGQDRSWIFAHADSGLPADHAAEFEQLVRNRSHGLPIAYLTGQREFWSLALRVTKQTLVPRPETEHLVEQALARLRPGVPASILELGTGAGGVALAIAKERPASHVIATDISRAAVEVARQNARKLQLGNLAFVACDWLAAFSGSFDLIVSNPPYIPAGDPHLDEGDVRHEPRLALAGGDDGLDCLRRICREAGALLQAKGWLLLEHGHDQGESVRALFAESGFSSISTHRDLAGHERVTAGQWRHDRAA